MTSVEQAYQQWLPADIHEELVSNRRMSTDQIMSKLPHLSENGEGG
jgi:hypothetical protein